MASENPQQINLVVSFDWNQIELVRHIVQPEDVRDLYTQIGQLNKNLAEANARFNEARKQADQASYRAEQAYRELKQKTDALKKAEATVDMLTEHAKTRQARAEQ